MFRESFSKQISLDDRMLTANSQVQRAVNDSRAKIVGDFIYPNIDESKFVKFFSDKASRPNIEIKKYVSFLVLERLYKLPESLAIEFLRCGALNFQYAIHTTQDDKQPLSESSLRRFRRKIEDYNKKHQCDILKEEVERISRLMGIEMGVLPASVDEEPDEKTKILIRMDSMQVEAHAKVMTRLEILYTTNVIVLKYLLKQDLDDFIPRQLLHYFDKDDHNKTLYYRAKEDEKAIIQKTRIETVASELVILYDKIHILFNKPFIDNTPELHVLDRVYNDQIIQDDTGKRIPKDKHDISPDSVQNPFDLTVTYRNKRGPHHGSVLNIAEAHDGKGHGVIIHAEIGPNTLSDNELEKRFVEQLPDNGTPIELQTDGAYGGDNLEKLEKEKNVTRKSTSLTGKAPDPYFASFELDEEGTSILHCPYRKTPTDCKYNENTGIITATMPDNCCANCPHRDECKAKVNNKKKKSTVRVKATTVKRAKHAKNLKSQEYKEAAAQRNSVEGIMSVMRQKYDIDRIPVFGLEQSKTWIWCSILAFNVAKYQSYKRSVEKNEIAA